MRRTPAQIKIQRRTLERYLTANKAEKKRILDRVVESSGANRKSAIRSMGEAGKAAVQEAVGDYLDMATHITQAIHHLRGMPGFPASALPVLDHIEDLCAEAFVEAEVPTHPRHPHQLSNSHGNSFGNSHGNSRVTDGAYLSSKLDTTTRNSEFKSSRTGGKSFETKMGNETEKKITVASRPRRASRAPLPEGEATQLLSAASVVMGAKYSVSKAYGIMALRVAADRIAEGFSTSDLLRSCRLAMKRWGGGDHWPPLRNLTYLWGASLPAILDGGEGSGQGAARGQAPVFREGEEAEAWARGCGEMPTATRAILLGPDK